MGLALFRDQVGEGGLSRARRPIEDKGHEPVGFDGPAKEFARTENVLLSGKFRQVPRPHSPGKRSLRGRVYVLQRIRLYVLLDSQGMLQEGCGELVTVQ